MRFAAALEKAQSSLHHSWVTFTCQYGDLQKLAGAIEASITPDNADPDVQYYDDIEGDVLYPDPELSFKTKMADIPLMIQEKIFGNKIDDNGVLVRTAQDKPPYYAVGFRSEKSDKTYRYICRTFFFADVPHYDFTKILYEFIYILTEKNQVEDESQCTTQAVAMFQCCIRASVHHEVL